MSFWAKCWTGCVMEWGGVAWLISLRLLWLLVLEHLKKKRKSNEDIIIRISSTLIHLRKPECSTLGRDTWSHTTSNHQVFPAHILLDQYSSKGAQQTNSNHSNNSTSISCLTTSINRTLNNCCAANNTTSQSPPILTLYFHQQHHHYHQ